MIPELLGGLKGGGGGGARKLPQNHLLVKNVNYGSYTREGREVFRFLWR